MSDTVVQDAVQQLAQRQRVHHTFLLIMWSPTFQMPHLRFLY